MPRGAGGVGGGVAFNCVTAFRIRINMNTYKA